MGYGVWCSGILSCVEGFLSDGHHRMEFDDEAEAEAAAHHEQRVDQESAIFVVPINTTGWRTFDAEREAHRERVKANLRRRFLKEDAP